MNSAVAPNTPTDQQLRLIVESYARLTGQLLVAENSDCRAALWNSSAVIVAHGTESDPIFFYGNRAALTLFEIDFAAFTKLPSRFSVEPLARAEREVLLQRVSRDGFIDFMPACVFHRAANASGLSRQWCGILSMPPAYVTARQRRLRSGVS